MAQLCIFVSMLTMLVAGFANTQPRKDFSPGLDYKFNLLDDIRGRLIRNEGKQRRHDAETADMKHQPMEANAEIADMKSHYDSEIDEHQRTETDTSIAYLQRHLTEKDVEIADLKRHLTKTDTVITDVIAEIAAMKNRYDAEIGDIKPQRTNTDAKIDDIKSLYDAEIVDLKPQRTETGTTITDLKRRINAEIDQLKQSVSDMLRTIQSVTYIPGGALYTRWGRTTCPGNGTETVYSGYTGGGHYTHSGSPAEYVCLPSDPLWGKYNDALHTGGLMYGAEYEDGPRTASLFGRKLFNLDVPCAVCRVTSRVTALMIPGRNQCYVGWHKEYSGYLMAGGYKQTAASQHVCVDAVPEALHASVFDKNGKLFYFVEGRCGSLQCPPYVNGRELTCVVCSK